MAHVLISQDNARPVKIQVLCTILVSHVIKHQLYVMMIRLAEEEHVNFLGNSAELTQIVEGIGRYAPMVYVLIDVRF